MRIHVIFLAQFRKWKLNSDWLLWAKMTAKWLWLLAISIFANFSGSLLETGSQKGRASCKPHLKVSILGAFWEGWKAFPQEGLKSFWLAFLKIGKYGKKVLEENSPFWIKSAKYNLHWRLPYLVLSWSYILSSISFIENSADFLLESLCCRHSANSYVI